MATVLGEASTPSILDAWKAAYSPLTNLMIMREKELYAEYAEWTTWRDFRIARKVRETEGITSFYLEPIDGDMLPVFKAGQYVSIQVNVPKLGYLQSRQYSLSDAPNTGYYRISIKRECSSFPSTISSDPQEGKDPESTTFVSIILHDSKKVGDILQISPPHGDFCLPNGSNEETGTGEEGSGEIPIVIISAGIGITPLMSMLTTLTSSSSSPSPAPTPRKISWIHASKSIDSIPFITDIHSITKSHPDITAKILSYYPQITNSSI